MRRRPGWVWGGASLVLVSGIGVGALVAAAGERETVLAVARDVPAGQTIQRGDLREVQVAADSGVVVRADHARTVVGHVAAVPLTAGSLLSARQVGDETSYPPNGQVEVSFSVARGDAPRELARGQRVGVYPGPGGGLGTDRAEDGPVPVVGTVTGVEESEASGGPLAVTVLIESPAAQRAALLERPRVAVLSSREAEAQ